MTPEFVAFLRKYEFRNLLRQAEVGMSREELAQAEENLEQAELPPIAKKKFEPSDFKAGQPRVVALTPDMTTLWMTPVARARSIIPL